jgi:hypothetical protein
LAKVRSRFSYFLSKKTADSGVFHAVFIAFSHFLARKNLIGGSIFGCLDRIFSGASFLLIEFSGLRRRFFIIADGAIFFLV